MKRALTILLALAAVACAKTEVAYDNTKSCEIALMPVSGGMTKAAILDAKFPTDNHIGLFAYYTPTISESGAVADYSKYDIKYFENTLFHCEAGAATWDGLESDYYWPATGTLVFAGYSVNSPSAEFFNGGVYTYDLVKDQLNINDFVQSPKTSSTYDLLYFGRTAAYNKNALSVPVTFQHALAWVEIQVKGDIGSLMGGARTWRVTNLEFDNLFICGNFRYSGTEGTATWKAHTKSEDIVVYTGSQALTADYAVIENTKAGTLVIPQTPHKLYAAIEYASPAGDAIKEVVEIDIPAYTTAWEAGKKYTYQLTFSPQEILVAPTVQTWPTEGQPGNVNTTWPN